MRHISAIFLSCLMMSSFGPSASLADDKVHMEIKPLAVMCGKSAEVLKTFVDKDSEIVLRSIDVVGSIFFAVRTKQGNTIFMTSPVEYNGEIICLITIIKQPDIKVEKHFGKPTGLDS